MIPIYPEDMPMKRVIKVAFCLMILMVLCPQLILAQKMTVKIIERQDKEDQYDYAAVYNNTAVGKTFKLHGATLTLELPDGRLTVVNCESKFAEHFAGPAGNKRSCRVPLINEIEAEFHGEDAKLKWSVSLDGKKMKQETYKILAVFDKPKE